MNQREEKETKACTELDRIGQAIGYGRAIQLLGQLYDDEMQRRYGEGHPRQQEAIFRRYDIEREENISGPVTEEAKRDLMLYGNAFEVDGKCVDPARVKIYHASSAPPVVPPGCATNSVVSRICQRGTKCCVVDHAEPFAPQVGSFVRYSGKFFDGEQEGIAEVVMRGCDKDGADDGSVLLEDVATREEVIAHDKECSPIHPDSDAVTLAELHSIGDIVVGVPTKIASV